ncbi:MAG: hypothetical protein IJP88_06690 [Synergistaceae bacterium]|nr:hypothetical protein [Synergistaceae bacterium]MBR0096851.1 hypothetical protein [Synergistaceae bacterium]
MQNFAMKINKSPFKNVYWFARALVNTDQYAAIGTSSEAKLLCAVNKIEIILSSSEILANQKLLIAKNILAEIIKSISKDGSKRRSQHLNFLEFINKEIKNLDDIIIFCITVKYIIAPINAALKSIPSSDKDFCIAAAKTILDNDGENAAGTVISVWDELGARGCLEAERLAVIESFANLIKNLNLLEIKHDKLDDNIIMTAFVQEFERRLGQKRKARGGQSLESVISFIFNYYKFKAVNKPEHFDQNIEVDKWFKCHDGWIIGISCKRTLRERWKQLSGAKSNDLSHYKIKEIWHIMTYDKDLSDDKIVNLGKERQIFYLNDKSDIYLRASQHSGMKDYIRPLSSLIKDIRGNILN